MKLEDLVTLINEATWFCKLAESDVENCFIQISTLAPWANESTDNDLLEVVANQMVWLPCSRDEEDPIHGLSLEERAEALGKKHQLSQQVREVYKTTLTSLGKFIGHPALKIGPHDFTEAARGAALFAARQATYEILLGVPIFWCQLMKVYSAGHWPCGILPNKQVVVL